MIKTKIDGIQLFCLMVVFMLGSALLLDIGKGAKQDAWLVPLSATFFGCLLFLVYIYLYKKYPESPLTEYTIKIFGKYIGSIISFCYVIYFIYIASRVLRDFEELLTSTTYYRTSIVTVGICMILALIYAICVGIEGFSRVTCLCFSIILITFLTLNSLYIIGGYIKVENLQPVLGGGIKKVWKELFPLGMTVPFGELITFTMILPYLNKTSKALRVGLFAIVVSGLWLSFNALVLTSVLGADMALRSTFPAFTAASHINIASFIQRLDTFIIVLMVMLGFVKIAIYFFCAVIGASGLFHIKASPPFIYFIGIIIFFSSLMIAPSYQAHIAEGLKVVPYFFHLPFHIGIPLLLLVTAYIKQKIKPAAL